MKKTTIIVLSAVAFVAGFLIFYQSRPVKQKTPDTSGVGQQVDDQQKWETKIDAQANVTVVVTPLDLLPQSAQWKFDVGMNTHSVELSQDMVKSSILIDDQGTEHQPTSWEGPIGGHHREGTLTFDRVTPTPKSVGLRISGVGGVVRNFVWKL